MLRGFPRATFRSCKGAIHSLRPDEREGNRFSFSSCGQTDARQVGWLPLGAISHREFRLHSVPVGLGGHRGVLTKERGEMTLVRTPNLKTNLAQGDIGL